MVVGEGISVKNGEAPLPSWASTGRVWVSGKNFSEQ